MAGFHINLSTTHCYLHVHCTCNPKTCCQNNSSVQRPYFQFHSILFDHIILIYIRFLVLSLVIIFMSIHSVKLHTCILHVCLQNLVYISTYNFRIEAFTLQNDSVTARWTWRDILEISWHFSEFSGLFPLLYLRSPVKLS